MGNFGRVRMSITLSFIVIFLLSTGASSSISSPQNVNQGKLGLGIVIPAGIAIKYWTGPLNSLDLQVGWDLDDENSRLNLDYLWYNFHLFSRLEDSNLAFYYGLGGKFCWGKKKESFGLRIIFGIDYIFKEIPFDFFLELSPTLQLFPKTDFQISPAVGIRYFFH